MGQGEAIFWVAMAAVAIMVGLAVVDFIHGANYIAITDGKNSLYASKSQAAW